MTPTRPLYFPSKAKQYLVYNVVFNRHTPYLPVMLFLPFTKSILEQLKMRPHDNRILNKLPHAIH